MLRALYDYALAHHLTLPAGYVNKTVKAYILLYEDGTFQDIELGDETAVPAPDIGSLANGKDKCNALLEKRSVVLPDAPTEKSRFFLETLKAGGEAEPMLRLCAAALENEETAAQIRSRLDARKIKDGDRITFKVGYRSVLESERVQEWWQHYRLRFKKSGAAGSTVCLITGEPTVPAVTTTPISGLQVVGGHARGDALICFDKNAFCSYGLKKAENAPVSEEAFGAVKAALDHLLTQAPILAGMKFVHWYDREIPQESDPILNCGDFVDFDVEVELPDDDTEELPDADRESREVAARKRADQLVESVDSGLQPPPLDDVSYYILLLTGVGGRVMIRRYERGSYQDLQRSLALWHQDLRLTNSHGTAPLKSCKLVKRLMYLLKRQKVDSRPFERLSKELSGLTSGIVTSILTGAPLPDTVAVRALAYIRSQMLSDGDDGEGTGQVPVPDGWACQWLKVWLIRKDRKRGEELMEKYNLNHPEPAYHCGGLMAVYAEIQQRAMKDVNAGVIQRYYASASRTPALVLSQLNRLSNYHLDKIESGAQARYLRDRLAELYVALGDRVPTTLSLEEQSYFALGYYQKWADLHTKRDNQTGTPEAADEEE